MLVSVLGQGPWCVACRGRRPGLRAVRRELEHPSLARTVRIMGGLLSPLRYAQVIYLTAPAAGPVVTRATAALREEDQPRLVVRELPSSALGQELAR